MRNRTYIWVTGLDARGNMTTAGPYESEPDAQDATAHLSQAQFHQLHTRQHDKARRILRERLSHSSRTRPTTDEPEPESDRQEHDPDRPRPIDRIRGMLGGRSQEEREIDDR